MVWVGRILKDHLVPIQYFGCPVLSPLPDQTTFFCRWTQQVLLGLAHPWLRTWRDTQSIWEMILLSCFGENKRIAPERGVGKPPLTELLGSVAHEHLWIPSQVTPPQKERWSQLRQREGWWVGSGTNPQSLPLTPPPLLVLPSSSPH